MSESLVARYSRREENANIATHALGVALSVAALVLMVLYAVQHGDPYHIVSVSIFGATLIMLYLGSTLYHAVNDPKTKHIFRVVDHSCIYLLIAGSYTPFTLVSLRGHWGWPLFGVTWGLAVAGIVFKVFFAKRFSVLATATYVGLGWLIVVAAGPVINHIPVGGLALLAAGGFMYTFGVIFYLWERIPYHHAIWHVMVMAGSFFHFLAVYYFVLPPLSA